MSMRLFGSPGEVVFFLTKTLVFIGKHTGLGLGQLSQFAVLKSEPSISSPRRPAV